MSLPRRILVTASLVAAVLTTALASGAVVATAAAAQTTTTAPQPAPAAAAALAQALKLPAPVIGMSPAPPIAQLVNAPTWLWLQPPWQSVSATGPAAGATVATIAQPTAVVFNMGNGDLVTCNGPGVPYNPRLPDSAQQTNCSYTYRKSSASQPGDSFRVTATVYWQETWFASNDRTPKTLGPVVSTSKPVAVRVAEAGSLNLQPPPPPVVSVPGSVINLPPVTVGGRPQPPPKPPEKKKDGGGIWGFIKHAPGAVWGVAKQAPGALWNGTKSVAGDVWGWTKSGAGDVWGWIKSGTGATWTFIKDIGTSAYHTVVDLGVLGYRTSIINALFNPNDYSKAWTDLGSGVLHLITHPVDLAKSLVDWKDLVGGHPGRAVPDILLLFVGVGEVVDVVKGIRAASAAAAAARVAAEQAAKDAAEQAAKDAAEQAAKDAAEQAAKDAAKQAAKEADQLAADAATAAELSDPSSKVLAQNMEQSGIPRPVDSAAHHVVAGSARFADPARAVLQKFGIDINAADNGVFLPKNIGVPNPDGSLVHSSLHTIQYYDRVNTLLAQATTRQEALDALTYIRNRLLAGKLP